MSQVKLDHWRPHVLAALQAKQSFAQYAREHSVSRHTLYVAHKLMKARGEIPPAATRSSASYTKPATPRSGHQPVSRSSFVPVQLTPAVHSVLTVRLPNGLELHFTAVEAGLLSLLASLPCSS